MLHLPPKYRTMQEMKMPDQTSTAVPAPCGCALTCDWPKGDRRVQCDCGRWWIVRKSSHIIEQYDLAKETFPS